MRAIIQIPDLSPQCECGTVWVPRFCNSSRILDGLRRDCTTFPPPPGVSFSICINKCRAEYDVGSLHHLDVLGNVLFVFKITEWLVVIIKSRIPYFFIFLVLYLFIYFSLLFDGK